MQLAGQNEPRKVSFGGGGIDFFVCMTLQFMSDWYICFVIIFLPCVILVVLKMTFDLERQVSLFSLCLLYLLLLEREDCKGAVG